MNQFAEQPVKDNYSENIPTFFQRPDKLHEKLYVLTTVFNSARYRTRWKHYSNFARMIHNHPGVELYTVEIAFGNRDFAITHSSNPRHLQLRTNSELWHKERSLNLLAQKLPSDWTKLAIIDADVYGVKPDWFDDTKHALEHYDVVQMWSRAHDLSPDGEIMNEHKSFASCYLAGFPIANDCNIHHGYDTKVGNKVYWHPGYCWAWRRSAWDTVGGLYDRAILGSADFHMAHALVGNAQNTLSNNLHSSYKQDILEWEERALLLRKNIGVVKGSIYHAWHGAKVSRKYRERWKILESNQYHPSRDLVTDSQGLYKFSHKASIELRDQIRAYFSVRNEDSTCLNGC